MVFFLIPLAKSPYNKNDYTLAQSMLLICIGKQPIEITLEKNKVCLEEILAHLLQKALKLCRVALTKNIN